MLTQGERDVISDVLENFLATQRPRGAFYNWIRKLNDDKDSWRLTDYECEELVIKVIKRTAKVHVRLVEGTPLRRAEELNYAVELAINWITQFDYEVAVDGLPNLSTSS